mmetsp:Transcript_18067/g.56566  ORF Transcript_18067/g.56566 Transcript_18067/m.56566 type:complete len:361 (-) Transcript_18067:529-1611(-)
MMTSWTTAMPSGSRAAAATSSSWSSSRTTEGSIFGSKPGTTGGAGGLGAGAFLAGSVAPIGSKGKASTGSSASAATSAAMRSSRKVITSASSSVATPCFMSYFLKLTASLSRTRPRRTDAALSPSEKGTTSSSFPWQTRTFRPRLAGATTALGEPKNGDKATAPPSGASGKLRAARTAQLAPCANPPNMMRFAGTPRASSRRTMACKYFTTGSATTSSTIHWPLVGKNQDCKRWPCNSCSGACGRRSRRPLVLSSTDIVSDMYLPPASPKPCSRIAHLSASPGPVSSGSSPGHALHTRLQASSTSSAVGVGEAVTGVRAGAAGGGGTGGAATGAAAGTDHCACVSSARAISVSMSKQSST